MEKYIGLLKMTANVFFLIYLFFAFSVSVHF